MLKRALSFFLTLLLCLSLFVGCNNRDHTDDKKQSSSTEQEDQPALFDYTAGDKATLEVLSTETLSKRYKHWDMSPSDCSTNEARIKELINLIDRQTWTSISSDFISAEQHDASLKLNRTLISEQNNSSPYDVGQSADIEYFFNLDEGTVIMVYLSLSSSVWDKCCTLSKEDISAVVEILYYYCSMHLE